MISHVARSVLPALLLPLLAAAAPASQPAPSLPQIIQSLSSPNFNERESAQRQLENTGPDNFDALRKLEAAETDPEVKSRLETRITQIEAFQVLHPPPLTVDFHEAPITTVIDSLNEQLGGKYLVHNNDLAVMSALKNHKPIPPPPLQNARFTLHAENQPFWFIIKSLAEQEPLGLGTFGDSQLNAIEVKAPPPRGIRNYDVMPGFAIIARCVDKKQGAGAVLSMLRNDRNMEIARAVAIKAGARGFTLSPTEPIAPDLLEINFSFTADPRIKIQKFSPILTLTQLKDSLGNDLLPFVQPPEDVPPPFGTPTLGGTPFVLFRRPAQIGPTLVTIKGTFNVTLALAQFHVVSDVLSETKPQSIRLPQNILNIVLSHDVNSRIIHFHLSPLPSDPSPPEEYKSPSAVALQIADAKERAFKNQMALTGEASERPGNDLYPNGIVVEATYPVKITDVSIPFEFKNIPVPPNLP